MIRSECGRIIRNQRALMRANSPYYFKKVRERVSFDIEFNFGVALQNNRELIDIRDSDVALIRPGMDGNSMRPGGDTLLRGMDYIWDPVVPGIAKQSYLIDIDAKAGHRLSAYLPVR